MKNPFVAHLVDNDPGRYPSALEARYERVLNKIVSLWGTPDLDAYFEDLMIDHRGGRQGFPPEIALEIFQLHQVWEKKKGQRTPDDPWGHERVRGQLEVAGMAFTPQNFARSVEKGDLRSVQMFLDAGMFVDTPGESGWTPLMTAAFNGNEDVALLLLNRGANARFTDSAGYTPLHWAAYNGFAKASRLLLSKHAAPDATTRYGWTPLMQAAARGHVAVVELLLEARADPNQSDKEGWTPLHKAVSNNHVEVAKLLLSKRANPGLPHQSGKTAADIGRASKNPGIRALFKE